MSIFLAFAILFGCLATIAGVLIIYADKFMRGIWKICFWFMVLYALCATGLHIALMFQS